jgi:hypothetical protein
MQETPQSSIPFDGVRYLSEDEVKQAITFAVQKIKDKNLMSGLLEGKAVQSCCDSFRATMYKKLGMKWETYLLK